MMAMAAVAGPQLRMCRAHVAVDGEKLMCGSGSRSTTSAAWRVVGLRVTGMFGLHISSSAPRQWVRVAALSEGVEDAAGEEELSSVEEQPAAPVYEGPTVKVTFEMQRECHFGQQFKVVGGDALFGDWDPTAAVPLNWSEGHVWTAQVDVPEGKKFEFKYVLTGQDGEVDWQPRANLELDAAAGSESLLISEPWGEVQATEPEPTTDWETTTSPEEDNTSTPADAVADAAASAAVGALDVGLKAATALEGLSDSVNGVAEEETPTAVEIPVVDAALAGAAAPAPAAPAAPAAAKPAEEALSGNGAIAESSPENKPASKEQVKRDEEPEAAEPKKRLNPFQKDIEWFSSLFGR